MIKLLHILAIFLITAPIYALTIDKADMKISVTPSTVEPGKTITLSIDYYIQARNDWFDVATRGRGIFFKIYIDNTVYRVGKSGCIANSLSDPSCDIPYTFDGRPLSGTSTFTFTAPLTEGKHTIKVEMWINRAAWFDKFVLTRTVTVNVKEVKEIPAPTHAPTKPNETAQPPSQIYGTCQFSNIRVWTEPSFVIEGEPFDLHITFTYTCTRTDDYGPFLKIRIRDKTYSIIKEWRAGDQGVTTDMNKNYYFDKSGGSKEVVIPNIVLSPGMYFITLEGIYSDSLSLDDPIFSEYRAYTLYVHSKTESPSEEAAEYITEPKLCSGKPILVMVAWTDESGAVMRSPSAKVGDVVYAVAKIRNPYTTCKYEGNLRITIRKDVIGGDKEVHSDQFSITLGPRDEEIIKLEFVPSEEGEYHFDVYWNNDKYGKDDVQVRYGTISCSSLDPTGCYVGPDLKVYKSTKEIYEETQKGETIYVTDYWFEQHGKNVTELVEGVVALGCVSLVSPVDTTATVTIQIKAHAGAKSIPIIGDLPPDPVKAEATKQIVFIANEPVTVCAKFIPRQTSAFHNERYYIAVLINGKEIGIFPTSKDGAILIPKTGKGNPLVEGQDERKDVLVIAHGWYTEDGDPVKGMVPSGTYLVKAELMNAGGYVANVKVKIKVRADKDLWFDSDIDECNVAVTLGPNATELVECPFDLSDGRYHYEIYIDGKKVVSRGPTIYVGLVGWIEKYVAPVIKSIGIPGLIILVILFFTGPYWIPFVIRTISAWVELLQFIRRR